MALTPKEVFTGPNMRKVSAMTENERLNALLDFMKLPDGSPLVTVNMIDWLVTNGFFHAPASTKYHGNHEGGLFDHSLAVVKHLVGLTESCQLKWKDCRSPYLVGMFHDLCKIDQYRHPKLDLHLLDGTELYSEHEWEYNPNTLLKGHGDKSVMLLSQFYALTEEEIMCIRYHMGAFCPKEEWNDYTRAVRAYPNVLWTHQADMLASHVEGV